MLPLVEVDLTTEDGVMYMGRVTNPDAIDIMQHFFMVMETVCKSVQHIPVQIVRTYLLMVHRFGVFRCGEVFFHTLHSTVVGVGGGVTGGVQRQVSLEDPQFAVSTRHLQFSSDHESVHPS